MKTSILAFVVALLLMVLGIVNVFQGNIISEHKKVLEAKDLQLAELNSDLDEEIEKVSQLELLNQTYEDSIKVLNERIVMLEQVIDEKNERIKYLKGKLKRRETAYQDIKDKIARLYRQDQLNKETISQLEREKEALRREMGYIQNDTKEVFAARQATENEVRTYRDNIYNMNLIHSIAKQTHVEFKEVTGKKFRNGRKISRMRRNMNGWQYTDFKFTLRHPDHKALLDQQFVLKIYDKEHGIPLAYLEQNPRYPSNQQKGIPFQFDGNMIELTYCNTQKKVSENFEVRLYLLHQGEEIPLNNGIAPIISNGDFI